MLFKLTDNANNCLCLVIFDTKSEVQECNYVSEEQTCGVEKLTLFASDGRFHKKGKDAH